MVEIASCAVTTSSSSGINNFYINPQTYTGSSWKNLQVFCLCFVISVSAILATPEKLHWEKKKGNFTPKFFFDKISFSELLNNCFCFLAMQKLIYGRQFWIWIRSPRVWLINKLTCPCTGAIIPFYPHKKFMLQLLISFAYLNVLFFTLLLFLTLVYWFNHRYIFIIIIPKCL